MNRFRFLLNTSLRTKVLVPVIVCMSALIATTVFVVNRRVTAQFEQQAKETLATADAEFLNLQKTRSEDLLLRFRNLPNEPRYRAAFQLGDPPTLHQPLVDLVGEQGADIVFYANPAKHVLASEKRDPAISTTAFESAAGPATQQALAGEPTVDTVYAGERLFHVEGGIRVYATPNIGFSGGYKAERYRVEDGDDFLLVRAHGPFFGGIFRF